MSITYSGIEWDYNNLEGIGYSSETLDQPYSTWFYLITSAVNYEKENILSISDDYEKGINKEGKEFLSISESIRRNFHKKIKESFITLNEKRTNRSINKADKEEVITLDEQRANRSINRADKEIVIKFNEHQYRSLDRLNGEHLSFIETPFRSIDRKDEESLISLSDLANRLVDRKNKESSLYLLDDGKFIATDSEGNVIIGEQIEISGSINLFDFEICAYPLKDSDFNNWVENNSPINYNELRPFIPGEYEYIDAYVGFRLSIPPTDGRFGVSGSTVYVDVEDTVEKGTASIEQNEVGSLKRVNFSKRFYTSPHIMTSLIYAVENCYVEVPTVTKEYFEFGLKSITTGQYLTGEISWLADGY